MGGDGSISVSQKIIQRLSRRRISVTLTYFDKDCSDCAILSREYESAAFKYFTLEAQLLFAFQRNDYESVHSLSPQVEKVWRIRHSLRAAIREHELMHMSRPSLRSAIDGIRTRAMGA